MRDGLPVRSQGTRAALPGHKSWALLLGPTVLALAALRCHLVWPFPPVPQDTLGSVAGASRAAARTQDHPVKRSPSRQWSGEPGSGNMGPQKTPLEAWLHLPSVSPTQPLSEEQAAAQERQNQEKWQCYHLRIAVVIGSGSDAVRLESLRVAQAW